MGKHPGFWYYTIGQRHGLGLSGGPWFVVKKDTQKNRIYISNEYFDEQKVRYSFQVDSLRWITGPPQDLANLQVKVRHGDVSYPASLTLETPTRGTVKIKGQDQGFAAGQFAVFYDGEYCLGGGMITD